MAIRYQGTLPQTEGKVSLKAAPRLVAPLAGAALLVALVVVLSFGAFRQVETSATARQHSYDLILRAEALLSELRDAEIGQRGFALSGDETFLDPYLAAHDSISGHLEELRRLTLISASQQRLDALAPLVHAKLAQMSSVIELRRDRNLPAVVAIVGSDQGTRLMESIRAGINGFIQIEEGVRARQEAEFESSMRELFALIIACSLFALMFALSFAHLIYRETRHRLGKLLHAETQHLLDVQEATNRQLQQTNVTLHMSEQKLASAKAEADKANLAKSDFLSSMSHELRTPLSAILGFAQLMECGSPLPTVSQKRSIDQILKAGWYLLDLINEILDLALIESGKLPLSLEPMSLTEVVRECEAMIEPQARKRGISVAFPRFDGPCFVQADRTRVKQVLINLLSNAIKYNRAGGTVAVDCIASTQERIRISVRDTGLGLPPEKLAQLFQPFNRLGQEGTAEEGTGIGLVVCKRLMELMGGDIGVASTVGTGSEFWIELNVTAQPRLAAGAAILATAAQPSLQDSAHVRTLLYVEDNPANLMLVEDLIERRPDIRLLSAADGIRGVEMARASHPDVILMDINLPGISGIHALEILAANPATAHIPVVALSANAMPRDIEKGLAAGFFRYLTKPIKVNEFLETLDMAFAFAKTEAARAIIEEKA